MAVQLYSEFDVLLYFTSTRLRSGLEAILGQQRRGMNSKVPLAGPDFNSAKVARLCDGELREITLRNLRMDQIRHVWHFFVPALKRGAQSRTLVPSVASNRVFQRHLSDHYCSFACP